MIVRALATSRINSRNRQPPEPDVAHDHIRLRQDQIVAVASIGVAFGTRHMQHAGTTQSGQTVGGTSGSSQLSRVGARPR